MKPIDVDYQAANLRMVLRQLSETVGILPELSNTLVFRVVAKDTIGIADDELLHELNREHRGVDGPTDVLSFAAEEGEAFPGAPDQPRYLGDIIVSVEGKAVDTPGKLRALLDDYKVGDRVRIGVLRGGKPLMLAVD